MSSYLFSPANVSKNLIKGLNSDTFAMIPDLEDSVPLEIKSNALNNLIDFINNNDLNNKIIYPRIHNSDDNTWIEEQISKLSVLNINGLVIPGVNDPKSFSKLYNLIKKYNNNLEIIPLIESVEGLDNMKDLIRGFNLNIISFGKYDFSLNLNIDPELQSSLIQYAKQKFAFTALANNCIPIDTPELNLSDKKNFESVCIKSNQIGFKGKYASHPDQISIINKCFNNIFFKEDEIKEIINEYEKLSSKGIGAFKYNNNIIDLPVYLNLKRKYNNI